MEFRRATRVDAEAILRLWRVAGATVSATDTAEHVCAVIEHDGVAFFLAVADEQIVGSLIGTFDGWRGHMYRLAVDPAHRRRGIARALVRQVEKAFSAWGVARVIALVERDRPEAQRFWEAVGYPSEDAVLRHVRTATPHAAG